MTLGFISQSQKRCDGLISTTQLQILTSFFSASKRISILLLSWKKLSLAGIQTKRRLLDLRYLGQLCNKFLQYVLPKLMLCCLPHSIPFHYQSLIFCPVFYLPSYIFSRSYFLLFSPLIHLSRFLLHFSFRLLCCRESRTCLAYS